MTPSPIVFMIDYKYSWQSDAAAQKEREKRRRKSSPVIEMEETVIAGITYEASCQCVCDMVHR
jgi:hypothetical protein